MSPPGAASRFHSPPSGGTARGIVSVPPSKSLTHRALLLAALARGRSHLTNPLKSDDTRATREALSLCGVVFESRGDNLLVTGLGGPLVPSGRTLPCRDSGTTLRLLMGLCAASPGSFLLDASPQLRRRPVEPLAEALRSLGASVRYRGQEGFAPVEVDGRRWAAGEVTVDGTLSSQFLSGLLLGALLAEGPIVLSARGLVSRPYAEMTAALMKRCGIAAEEAGESAWRVKPRIPGAFEMAIEPDASSASYFLAAAAVTGGDVTVPGIGREMLQGDAAILDLLARFGAEVAESEGGARVRGERLRGIEARVARTPDLVPTLAAVALFAEGSTRLSGVGHLRYKESDRLAVLATAVSRLGGSALLSEDSIEIRPRALYAGGPGPEGRPQDGHGLRRHGGQGPRNQGPGPRLRLEVLPGILGKVEAAFRPMIRMHLGEISFGVHRRRGAKRPPQAICRSWPSWPKRAKIDPYCSRDGAWELRS